MSVLEKEIETEESKAASLSDEAGLDFIRNIGTREQPEIISRDQERQSPTETIPTSELTAADVGKDFDKFENIYTDHSLTLDLSDGKVDLKNDSGSLMSTGLNAEDIPAYSSAVASAHSSGRGNFTSFDQESKTAYATIFLKTSESNVSWYLYSYKKGDAEQDEREQDENDAEQEPNEKTGAPEEINSVINSGDRLSLGDTSSFKNTTTENTTASLLEFLSSIKRVEDNQTETEVEDALQNGEDVLESVPDEFEEFIDNHDQSFLQLPTEKLAQSAPQEAHSPIALGLDFPASITTSVRIASEEAPKTLATITVSKNVTKAEIVDASPPAAITIEVSKVNEPKSKESPEFSTNLNGDNRITTEILRVIQEEQAEEPAAKTVEETIQIEKPNSSTEVEVADNLDAYIEESAFRAGPGPVRQEEAAKAEPRARPTTEIEDLDALETHFASEFSIPQRTGDPAKQTTQSSAARNQTEKINSKKETANEYSEGQMATQISESEPEFPNSHDSIKNPNDLVINQVESEQPTVIVQQEKPAELNLNPRPQTPEKAPGDEPTMTESGNAPEAAHIIESQIAVETEPEIELPKESTAETATLPKAFQVEAEPETEESGAAQTSFQEFNQRTAETTGISLDSDVLISVDKATNEQHILRSPQRFGRGILSAQQNANSAQVTAGDIGNPLAKTASTKAI